MEILLKHLRSTRNSTLSQLYIDGEPFCYVLEDGYRSTKVKGETRISAGRYEVVARKVGGFYNRYRKRYGHEFVPWLIDVPDFEYILIHIGNWIEDTRGCLLVGSAYAQKKDTRDYYVIDSTAAYKRLYKELRACYLRKERVYITVYRPSIVSDVPPPTQVPDLRKYKSPSPTPPPPPPTATNWLSQLWAWLRILFP